MKKKKIFAIVIVFSISILLSIAQVKADTWVHCYGAECCPVGHTRFAECITHLCNGWDNFQTCVYCD